MPKPSLKPEFARLESEIIETLLAGHHEWRPDLPYPESRSDMKGAVRALLRRYEVKRRGTDIQLEYEEYEAARPGWAYLGAFDVYSMSANAKESAKAIDRIRTLFDDRGVECRIYWGLFGDSHEARIYYERTANVVPPIRSEVENAIRDTRYELR